MFHVSGFQAFIKRHSLIARLQWIGPLTGNSATELRHVQNGILIRMSKVGIITEMAAMQVTMILYIGYLCFGAAAGIPCADYPAAPNNSTFSKGLADHGRKRFKVNLVF